MTSRAPERTTDVLARAHAGAPPPSELLGPGSAVGSWRIRGPIAAGGCGAVYAADHAVLQRDAAVKVLHAALVGSPVMVERFVREARAVNAIRHPNIVDIFDFGALPDGRPYFVMELLAPGDLEQRVAARGRLTLAEIVEIVEPVCRALDAAHRAGYIHRDLKARNIGFARDRAGTPKLLDFGIAKLLDDGRDSATGTVRLGTPHCMSPEQIRGEHVDARTDVYALGVLLHQLLTGRYPFETDAAAELERMHLEAPPPLPSRLAPVPPALDALVARAMAKRPADRPASARELLSLLIAATARARRADAIAIRVALEPAALDDAAIDDAADAAERAATLLGEHGFTTVLATATSVLAARTAGTDPAAAWARAQQLATTISRALADRPTRARVAVHAAPAEIADDSGAFVGGPLLDELTWPDDAS